MLAALAGLGIANWAVDVGPALPASAGPRRTAPAAPQGAPLVLHVNAPLLPLALRHIPDGLVRGRRIIGYWAWELPTVPPGWRLGTRFVHEVWAPSRFTAAALETLAARPSAGGAAPCGCGPTRAGTVRPRRLRLAE